MWNYPFDTSPGQVLATTFDSMRLGWAVARLTDDAGHVIACRLMGLSGLRDLPVGESVEMLREKTPAVVEGATSAALTAWSGANASQIWLASLAPFQSGARANRRRLLDG